MTTISNSPTGWQPDPDFRGTFNIVSTCLTTLLFCLWSAVHVEIPAHSGMLRGLWVRLGWIFVGLVTPETLLFIAYRQWTIARALLSDAKKCEAFPLHDAPKPWYYWATEAIGIRQEYEEVQDSRPKCTKKYCWTMIHSYYAAMGGFVFDTTETDEGDAAKPFLPELYGESGRAVITPEGIQFLLKHKPELLPDLSIEEISDRNKRNSLSKSVLVVQVSFFVIDCIARKLQGLPITLLEVTTVAHALCSLLAYVCWWSKPLSVNQPAFIRGKEARETCALMCMASTGRYYFLAGYLMVWRPAELDSMYYHGISPNLEKQSLSQIPKNPTIDFSPCSSSYSKDGMLPWLDRTVGNWALGRQPWYRRKQRVSGDVEYAQDGVTDPLDKDKERWILASVAAKKLMCAVQRLRKPLNPRTKELRYTDALVSPTTGLSACLKYRGGNPRKFTLNEEDPGPFAATVLAVLFGFPSIIAWNFNFPTPFDQFLWRGAAIAAVFRGTIYWAARKVGLWATKRTSNRFVRKAAAVIPVTLLMALLIPSSTILVFESFKQLLYLPPAAYQVPNLSRYWPHF
ncbi:hypothetical protein F5050DRAFT_215211 [Lentinula boryana]|uniref:Uncharacterized protein n=1 Tax=Lentinula boryana TaxID=40481 RepID=A0ABQ8QBJ1_9AGAR|nr:hypothetical protein F5050DRAFT_215211 [Lentinula boryana]